jgi:hypothetical protein
MASRYVPAGQFSGALAPLTQNLPAGHGKHASAVVAPVALE